MLYLQNFLSKSTIMARTLKFSLKDREYAASPTKIDRKKLYGWTETLALDDDGNECKLVNADETGTFIIPKGGTGLGILSESGKWVNRAQLQAVNQNDEPADLISSSFNVTINLEQKVTQETYLDHNITAVYQMDDTDEALIEAIGDDIYTFSYSYRDSYDGSPAFLLTADVPEMGKKLFLMIGIENNFEMLALEEMGIIEETEEETDTEEELDFSMF